MNKYFKLLVSVVVCELVGVAATPFTITAIPTWYSTLAKPTLSPPNWIFGPVWTTLYALMGISLFLMWEKGISKRKVKNALLFFYLQLALNFSWSLLFFGLRAPLFGLIDIVILFIAIVVTIKMFHKISTRAAYLLVPYLLWVGFATYLNYSIWILNR